MERSSKEENLGKAVVVLAYPWMVILLVIVLFPIVFVTSWFDMKVWNWFAAPYFHLPPISLAVSIGLGLLVQSQ